jgi:hypothetical protein
MSGGSGTAEFAVVCACSRWPHTPACLVEVRAAGAEDVDWSRVATLAVRHRVAGLVAAGLAAAGLPVPPALAEQARRDAMTALRLSAEAVRLDRAMAAAGIPALYVKGTTLAQLVYGSLTVRHGKDIDAVVAPGAVPAAWRVLDALGYHRISPARDLSPAAARAYLDAAKDSVHRNPRIHAEVELHWQLSEIDHNVVLPPPALWRAVPVSPTAVLHTLDDGRLFVYLCAHGAAHVWARLKWLADVAAMIEQAEDGGAALWRAAVAARAERTAALAILLSQEVFGTAPPPGFAVRKSRRLRALLAISRWSLAPRDGDIEIHEHAMSPWAARLGGLLVARDWRARGRAVRNVMLPSEDIVLLQLPRGLGFLYPLLRAPVWAWKRSRRGH